MEIFVENLEVSCAIGVHDWEQATRQRLLISFTLFMPGNPKADERVSVNPSRVTDELADTADYALACEKILNLASRGRFRLIETLAQRAGDLLLETFPIDGAVVEIRKPAAVAAAESAGVRVVVKR